MRPPSIVTVPLSRIPGAGNLGQSRRAREWDALHEPLTDLLRSGATEVCFGGKSWRPRPELNRGTRFCRPLRNHSATWPFVHGLATSAAVTALAGSALAIQDAN